MSFIKLPFYRRVLRRLLVDTAYLYSDKFFLKAFFWLVMGKRLDLVHPKSFSEKLQWLKLYHKRPEYTKMVDKIEAKKYVASIIGDEYIIPTIATYERVEDVDFDNLEFYLLGTILEEFYQILLQIFLVRLNQLQQFCRQFSFDLYLLVILKILRKIL